MNPRQIALLLTCVACIGLRAAGSMAAGTADAALPAYHPEGQVSGELSSIGDGAMKKLMDAWLAAFVKRQPGVRPARWEHAGDAMAIGALMFETADMAPLAREAQSAEIAPYAHQFSGDMMKAPLMVRVATLDERPAYIALNKRPGSPLPAKTREFLAFALSRDGQEIASRIPGFSPLAAPDASRELAKLEGYVADLDPALPTYRATVRASGPVRSVGSDGMKTLMDRWMREFHKLQPGVVPGSRWEHLGTLNGFHALIANETDIAPMGRELWPAELAAYEAAQHRAAPLEIRVARGGFNTPQRTTAQAIFVHQDNPLAGISLPQLAAIFGNPPAITRWGQLGLGGEWATRPIAIYMPARVAPNATSMQVMALKGGAWSANVHEGSIAETAAAIARDPNAIGFGGFEEGGPGIKALAVARDEGGPYVEGTAPNASSGRYPLTRYMYIRMNRKPGEASPAQVKEFLRYILSREGQEPILYSGYFPLTASEVKEELAKLD
ncbi:MAG TPA: substrate-binding domain-containing protein [Usitatibacter sp.]